MARQTRAQTQEAQPVVVDTETQSIIDELGYDYRDEVKFDDGKPFLFDWYVIRTNKGAITDYLESQVARLVDEGKPVIRAIMTHPDEMAQLECMRALKRLGVYEMVNVRLVPGVENDLPRNDPHGNALPADKQGKILMAKTGTVGGALENAHEQPEQIRQRYYAANVDQRIKMYRLKPTLQNRVYKCVDVGFTPKTVKFDDAVSLLRNWGYGVAFPQITGLRKDFQDPTKRPQNKWLVLEVAQ